uniref:Uncharacterized protein n=1 Tax=Ciona savignyi TaxID=51511 RepID=H2ZPR9_CIOSA
MQVRSPVKRKEDELQHRVVILEASAEAMRETEKHLRDEVKLLESQLQSSKEESANLNEVLRRNDCAKVNLFNEEIRSLQIKLEEMEQSHSAQLCGMKAEVTNLTTHLHGRDANIARLNEHCSE